MKPICSIKGGWCIEPVEISMLARGWVSVQAARGVRAFCLPKGVTFERFMQDYTGCPGPIYYVKEEKEDV